MVKPNPKLPERKKCVGDTFLVQDCKMREHFGIQENASGVFAQPLNLCTASGVV